MKHLQLVITLAWLAGPAALAHAQNVPADAIYFGGAIVTMDDTNPGAEAIAVKGCKIVAVGKKNAVLKQHQGSGTKVINLRGKTMLPGFIDGHSHFINSLMVPTQANCYSPPAGPANSIAAIIKALKDLQEQQKIPEGEDKFIMGYGYDPNGLGGGPELTAADLDKDFPKNPVIVGHVSLHGAVLNTVALRVCKITADTATPEGGVIARNPDGTPAGLLMETAYARSFPTCRNRPMTRCWLGSRPAKKSTPPPASPRHRKGRRFPTTWNCSRRQQNRICYSSTLWPTRSSGMRKRSSRIIQPTPSGSTKTA